MYKKEVLGLVAVGATVVAVWTAGGDSHPQLPLISGAYSSAVTQSNILETVCVRGYTGTVRPSQGYTTALKRRQIALQGLPGGTGDYEEDHLVPLSLGGAPSSESNLWPEPWAQARKADVLEYSVYRSVCRGTLTLKQGQTKILRYKRRYG